MIILDLLPPPDIHAPWPYHGLTGWTSDALAEVLKLAQFGAWAAGELRGNLGGEIEGGYAQDAMERFGVLVKNEVTESCGEDCICVEYGEFPVDCYKFPPGVAQILKECGK